MTANSRREFLGATSASVVALALPRVARAAAAAGPSSGVEMEIQKRHAEGVERLQAWVRQPSIAAENRGMNEGCELMMRLAREAGFESVTRVPTEGQAGV